jgi:hypothetical protein
VKDDNTAPGISVYQPARLTLDLYTGFAALSHAFQKKVYDQSMRVMLLSLVVAVLTLLAAILLALPPRASAGLYAPGATLLG